ncbi:Hypothetical protein mma_3168 [Janthinobacterium sp. Marseille]|nr:hypothetical protein [Janthinobacterium sp. Marseille]ABR91851.1 Hypothetical protein mma_3168 [Janthinobacterium sp. Marseille]
MINLNNQSQAQYHAPQVRYAKEVHHALGLVYEMRISADDDTLGYLFSKTRKKDDYVVQFAYHKEAMQHLQRIGSGSGITPIAFLRVMEMVDRIIRDNNSPESVVYGKLSLDATKAIYTMMMDAYIAVETNYAPIINHDPDDLLEEYLTDQQQGYLDIVYKNETPEEYERIKAIYFNCQGFHWRDYSPYDALADIEFQKEISAKVAAHQAKAAAQKISDGDSA